MGEPRERRLTAKESVTAVTCGCEKKGKTDCRTEKMMQKKKWVRPNLLGRGGGGKSGKWGVLGGVGPKKYETHSRMKAG